MYATKKIDEDEFEEMNEGYKRKIIEKSSKLIDTKKEKKKKELLDNNEKIQSFFDFEKVKITNEFIHEKIAKIYVKQIKKNHVKVKINFHFDLRLSEVDKKSISLGLTR